MCCLKMDDKEVLRYLGHKNQTIDKYIFKLIEECRSEIKQITKGRYIYKFFDITIEKQNIKLDNTVFEFDSNNLSRLLQNCSSCILMAVTLGSEIDSKMRYYQVTDMTKAVVFDACANAAIEDLCDNAQDEVKSKIGNKSLTMRYSPGYGDLPVTFQKSFLSAVNADRAIGLTSNSSDILFPSKSVTAVCGVTNEKIRNTNQNCSKCNKYNDCSFKKRSSSYEC